MTDLTNEATLGYNGYDNPHLWSSSSYIAHELGRHLQDSGRTAPRDVRMSRGYTIRANDMLFAWKERSFERLK
jgi:hypothetical protein